MVYTLEELPYSYDALEPYIDEQTMRIHHTRHHQTYIDKLNAAVKDYDDWNHKHPEDLLRDLSAIPEEIRTAVRNHGGGHANHSFFWPLLKKNMDFGGKIAEAINDRFESYDAFKATFSNAAATLFGSGWTWLVFDRGSLEIMTTPNQDSPISQGKTPIIGLDVWEHAYYLKYQNRRPEYISAFFEVINWEKADEHYQRANS